MAKKLLTAPIPELRSALCPPQPPGRTQPPTTLLRMVLEGVAGGLVRSRLDLKDLISITLWAAEAGERESNECEDMLDNLLQFLAKHRFLEIHPDGTIAPTQLAMGTVASSLGPFDALAAFADLKEAAKGLSLETELHLIYLVTPIYADSEWGGEADWKTYHRLWMRLSPEMRRVGLLVGVRDAFIIRMTCIHPSAVMSPDQLRERAIHLRFYTALAFNDLVNELSVADAAVKYNCTRGRMQQLQQNGSTYAGMVTKFCERLGWQNFATLLSGFAERICFGVKKDVTDLVKVPGIDGYRARVFHNNGITSINDLVKASTHEILVALRKAVPFESNETSAKHSWLADQPAMTEAQSVAWIQRAAKEVLRDNLFAVGISGDLIASEPKSPVKQRPTVSRSVNHNHSDKDRHRTENHSSDKLHQPIDKDQIIQKLHSVDHVACVNDRVSVDQPAPNHFQQSTGSTTQPSPVPPRSPTNVSETSDGDTIAKPDTVPYKSPISEQLDLTEKCKPPDQQLKSYQPKILSRPDSLDVFETAPCLGNGTDSSLTRSPTDSSSSDLFETPPVETDHDKIHDKRPTSGRGELELEQMGLVTDDSDSCLFSASTSFHSYPVETATDPIENESFQTARPLNPEEKLEQEEMAFITDDSDSTAEDVSHDMSARFHQLSISGINKSPLITPSSSLREESDEVFKSSTPLHGVPDDQIDKDESTNSGKDFFEDASPAESPEVRMVRQKRGLFRIRTPTATPSPVFRKRGKQSQRFFETSVPLSRTHESPKTIHRSEENKAFTVPQFGRPLTVLRPSNESGLGNSVLNHTTLPDGDKYSLAFHMVRADSTEGSVPRTEGLRLRRMIAKGFSVCSNSDAEDHFYVSFAKDANQSEERNPTKILSHIISRDCCSIAVEDALLFFRILVLLGLINQLAARVFCLKTASWLLFQDGSFQGLRELSFTFLPSPSSQKLATVFQGTQRCVQESRAVFDLEPVLKERLDNMKLNEAMHRIEIPARKALAKMIGSGLATDWELLSQLRKHLESEILRLEEKAHDLAGRSFSLSSPAEISKILFQEMKLPCPEKKAGSSKQSKFPGTSKEILEKLVSTTSHPLPSIILQWRGIHNNLTSTIWPLSSTYRVKESHAGDNLDRVTGMFEPFTLTGRITMFDFNFQMISKSKFPFRERQLSLRSVFIASSGYSLVAADFSQLELRILAHFSGDTELLRVLNSEKGDVFRQIAGKIHSVNPEDVVDEQRQAAKKICYGIIYGMGVSRLKDQLDVDEDSAREFMDSFKRTFPGVQQWINATLLECQRVGYIKTLAGRRRSLPDIRSPKPGLRSAAERQAINTTIQGSAADLFKAALGRAEFSLRWHPHVRLLLQLHDEIIFEVPDGQVSLIASLIKYEMENCWQNPPLRVSLIAKTQKGKNWGDLESFG